MTRAHVQVVRVLILAAPLLAARAKAQSVGARAEGLAEGGYDSNIFLPFLPDPRSANFVKVAGPFLRLAPSVNAYASWSRTQLDVGYALDLMAAREAGWIPYHQVLAGLLQRWGHVRARLGAEGFDLHPSELSDVRHRGGAGVVSAGWRATSWLDAVASYRLAARRYDATDGLEVVNAADVATTVLPSPNVSIALGVSGLLLRHAATDTDVRRARARLAGEWVTGHFTVGAEAWGGVTRAPLDADDVHGGASLSLRAPVSARWSLTASADVYASRSTEAAADARRFAVDLGIVGTFDASHTRRSPPDATPRARHPDAPLVDGRRARLRVRAPSAQQVRVIGTWDDWAPEGMPLVRQNDGTWEVWITLRPGRHRYHFLVDGKGLVPPGAAFLEADDFGSQDGVIEIPENIEEHP